MNLVRLQYVSDIHLEIWPSRFRRFLKPSGDILVLAGDIGYPFRRIFEQFLHWCSLKFPFVVLVPGNHEYYGHSIPKIDRRLKQVCRKYGVYYLEKDLLEIPEWNLVILGTTLWSKIPHEKTFDVLKTINDYQSILGLSPQVVDDMYSENCQWLQGQINFYREYNPEYRIVVVTHHAPEINHTISPKYLGDTENCAFASDCTHLMEGVHLWIYGHTHYNNTFEIGSTIVTSNQRGGQENLGYSKNRVIKIEKSGQRNNQKSTMDSTCCFNCDTNVRGSGDFNCSSCENFVCNDCCNEGKDEIMQWVSEFDGVEYMMSEDELRDNEDLVGEALDTGDYYCPECYQTKSL